MRRGVAPGARRYQDAPSSSLRSSVPPPAPEAVTRVAWLASGRVVKISIPDADPDGLESGS